MKQSVITKKFPKITIITPSYNQEEYLERTIKSVIDQNYPNLEYLIFDGASTDDSVKIIKKYQKYLKYWQSKKDQGQANAVEKGLNQSTGDILCWLNSDDILLPGSLNLLATIFNRYPEITWLTSQPFSVDSNNNIVQTGRFTGKLSSLIKLGFYHGKGLGFIPQEGTFWRRSLWIKSGKFIDKKYFCLDFKLWQRFAKYASLVTLEAPLAAFRLNPNRKTNIMNHYYHDIHPLMAYIPKYFGIIGRIIHPIFHRICPHIYYDRYQYRWIFYKGPFFFPGIKTK